MEETDNTMKEESGYWRSLRELYDQKSVTELKADEFMSGVTDDFQLSELSSFSRRKFLALLSSSAAFAAAGCSTYRDKGEIVPYTKKPEEVTPGVANYYASTCAGCSQTCGILIKTREGRPIKIDGNPDHPVNQGKICSTGQASILNLYDPYRLRKPNHGSQSGKSGELSWKQIDSDVRNKLAQCSTSGKQIAIITNSILSPTTKKVLSDFTSKYPTSKVYSYEYFHDENRRRAWNACYGNRNLPIVEWDKANVIVALESDFLGTDGDSIETIRKYTDGRDIMKRNMFNRLYSIEGTMTLTGANADYRMRLHPDAQLEFILSLINELAARNAVHIDANITHIVAQNSLKSFIARHEISEKITNHLITDLIANKGKSIVHAGDGLPEMVHIAVNHLNEILGNTALYHSKQYRIEQSSLSTPDDFDSLLNAMKNNQVEVVIHFGSNPVYHLPKSFDYQNALKSVPLSISLAESENETGALCHYVLPVHHAFESWGDYQTRSGITSLQQPVIAPLYDSRQRESILLNWMSNDGVYQESMYHEYLLSRWEKEFYPTLNRKVDFKTFWYASLHDGVVTDKTNVGSTNTFNLSALSEIQGEKTSSDYAVALRENYFIGDGSYANNGWLQELPHPVSKIVWDNYAAISQKTAHELGVDNNDMIEISLPHGKQSFPVFIQPGQADKCISIEIGYGRWNAGPIGNSVGTDANMLLSKDGLLNTRIYTNGKVSKVAGHHDLVSTQEHHSLDDTFLKDLHLKRDIIQEGTVLQYKDDPEFLHHKKHELFNIAPGIEYKGVKWAMAIDLNKCIGCNACVAGCNVENNIPVVGKEQVQRGREMHWIRLDRYYSGSETEPGLSHQPMLCQHCDNAPCENVCPVVATNHSPDGLNQMVYNRCVGTKYCSNNCPYKVRRFNFFNFRDNLADAYYEKEPISLVHNPEVTVRSRGVMEKCTFCVQRIAEARQHAAEQGKELKGSDVKTACQDACPAQAIVFGDMNDSKSEITKYRNHDLGYHVLEETNARPNVTYIARLKNRNESDNKHES